MKIVDEALIEACQKSEEEKLSWLFLEAHPEFEGFWKVQSFDNAYFFELKDLVGPYRAISPFKLTKFTEAAKEAGYKVAFLEDPEGILNNFERLNEPPNFSLNSSFDNTVNGMLPFQIQGFNYLKDVRGGMAVHSTGTGKSRLASALIKNGKLNDGIDIALVVAKGHNLTNFQRSLAKDADIESVIAAGDKKKRTKIYESKPEVLILNYEKFRVDKDLLIPLVEGKKVLVIWDEMSAKLSNRKSKLYKSVVETLYNGKRPQISTIRAKSLKQIATTATPIEVSPEGFYNCMRILDPEVLGTVQQFYTNYVQSFNRFREWEPESWHRLDRLGMQVEHVVHQVDKSDPDIAKWFPEEVHTELVVDWADKDRKIYDMLTKDAFKHGFDKENPLALITVLQMLCDAPTIIQDSASLYDAYNDAFDAYLEKGGSEPMKKGSEIAAELVQRLGKELNNDTHTKFDALKELLTEKHSNEKAIVFSVLNTGLMPVIKSKFKEWGVTYVEYEGTSAQKQEAQDKFMKDPNIQVFLSSDKGSDSLDLYEASVVINYDLPWNWSRLQQRNNRIHRIVSTHKTVYYYDLMMANSVEDRKKQLIEQKKGFHDGVFRGSLADKSASARMTKADLLYALRG